MLHKPSFCTTERWTGWPLGLPQSHHHQLLEITLFFINLWYIRHYVLTVHTFLFLSYNKYCIFITFSQPFTSISWVRSGGILKMSRWHYNIFLTSLIKSNMLFLPWCICVHHIFFSSSEFSFPCLRCSAKFLVNFSCTFEDSFKIYIYFYLKYW